jgi:hypothetical protein
MKNIYLDWSHFQNYLEGQYSKETCAAIQKCTIRFSYFHLIDLFASESPTKVLERLKKLDQLDNVKFLSTYDDISLKEIKGEINFKDNNEILKNNLNEIYTVELSEEITYRRFEDLYETYDDLHKLFIKIKTDLLQILKMLYSDQKKFKNQKNYNWFIERLLFEVKSEGGSGCTYKNLNEKYPLYFVQNMYLFHLAKLFRNNNPDSKNFKKYYQGSPIDQNHLLGFITCDLFSCDMSSYKILTNIGYRLDKVIDPSNFELDLIKKV